MTTDTTPVLTFCNCATCGIELLGARWLDWYRKLRAAERVQYNGVVAGRANGRPYCHVCLRTRNKPAGAAGEVGE